MLELTPAHKHRILFTEDHDDSREALRLLLEMEGFHVTCAATSADALSLAGAEKFDLYLLDNRLPEMPGELLCRKLREVDAISPILFYSGAATEAEKARAMDSGAQGYIVKPADLAELTAEINRLLSLPRTDKPGQPQ